MLDQALRLRESRDLRRLLLFYPQNPQNDVYSDVHSMIPANQIVKDENLSSFQFLNDPFHFWLG